MMWMILADSAGAEAARAAILRAVAGDFGVGEPARGVGRLGTGATGAGPFASRSEAETLCSRLKTRDLYCLLAF